MAEASYQGQIRSEQGTWLPGVSGNPSGRPKSEVSLTAILRERVDAKAIADKLIELAMAGEPALLKYVYDRLDGSPRSSGELMLRGESLDEVAERVAQRTNGHGEAP